MGFGKTNVASWVISGVPVDGIVVMSNRPPMLRIVGIHKWLNNWY
jgi:hypothetical protein